MTDPSPAYGAVHGEPLPRFCDTWPWSGSDLDLVTPEQNMAVHRARGCCRGGFCVGCDERQAAPGSDLCAVCHDVL